MSDSTGKYRLLTRSDFDGLVCAILLKNMDILADIKFVHPKDIQDGKIEVTDRDILTNLPYVESCHRCFDHHSSEVIRGAGAGRENQILDPNADSAARVVYNSYGGRERFPDVSVEMLEAVDKADSARFTKEEVLNPTGWALMAFIMDARTGLGRFRNFRVSNYQLMMDLIDYCNDHTIDEILGLPDVRERIELYMSHQEDFKDQIERCSTLHDKLIVLDLRQEERVYCGNRFMVYALYPQCTVSIHVLWGLKKQNTVLTIGKSIFDRSSKTDIGELALQYGGGGHEAAGTCQIAHEDAERVLGEIIAKINADRN